MSLVRVARALLGDAELDEEGGAVRLALALIHGDVGVVDGLVELADDDRATLYGAMLELAGRVREDKAGDLLVLWKRRGRRAFDAEAEEQEDSQ